MSQTQTSIEFKTGGISEFAEFTIALNYKLDQYDNICQHAKDGVMPMVVIARNEGGNNITTVCAQCICLAVDSIYHPTEPLEGCPEVKSIT